MSENESQIRLSKYFIPSHYEIYLDLDVINLSYKSKISIDITSQKDNPKYLILNSLFVSKEGKISNFKLLALSDDNKEENYIINNSDKSQNGYTQTVRSIYFELKPGIKNGQKLIFKCEKNDAIKISQEGYGLYICFWDYKLRKLLDKNEFYINKYFNNFKDKNNPTIEEIRQKMDYFNSLVITLNSSPVALRELIPCFDEPCFKSTFRLTISVNKNLANSSKFFTIVSNSDLNKVIEEDNKKIYCFKSTPLMSTYLLTFTIGFYEYSEKYINKKDGNRIRLRLYTPLNQINDNDKYLSLIEDALKRYEKLFDYPYELEKLDSIFIPNMNFTAMEFFGCITFRQILLLDNNNIDSYTYRLIIKDVYHEVFHNWIGNLTTMEFFNNTWLNEGLTKFMENYLSINFGKAYLDELMELSYFNTLCQRTHAINNKLINDEESIRKCFDNITYEKSGYIMFMLVSLFGEEKIFQGLKLFFEKYKYKSANEKDFFNIMSKACNYDISYLLNEWIYEKSFPVLNIIFSQQKDEIIIEQKPCFGKDEVVFKIPVFIKTKNIDKVILMKEKKLILKLVDFHMSFEDIRLKNNFIVVNSDIKCFCISNYLDEILKDAIIHFYNDNDKRVSDADIYQILISERLLIFHGYSKNNTFTKDISKLRNVKNFEILKIIIYLLTLPLFVNNFFYDELNKNNNEIIKSYNELKYGVIDYNNLDLIEKILIKFDKISNDREEGQSGEIDYDKYFILIICLYKRDENIIKKIFEIFKKNEFNFYKINQDFRYILPLIINEFMYLFEEKDKIKVYKSMHQYYEEMQYFLFYPNNKYFKDSLNNINRGFSFDILDFYFEKNDIKNIESIDDIIVDYFFNYISKLNDKNNKGGNLFDYLYEIGVDKSFNINNIRLNKIYEAYLEFVNHMDIDRKKLCNYIDEKYLKLKNINNKDKIINLKKVLKIIDI